MRITFFILLFAFWINSFPQHINPERDNAFPIWLKKDSIRTDQTSGIAFVKNENGNQIFILSDDVGDLFKLSLKDDSISSLDKINFSPVAEEFLSRFPKADFEEIFYDKADEKFYLSIEGNGENFLEFAGIYRLTFSQSMDSLLNIAKLEIKNFDKASQFFENNIAIEGLASDSAFFYLGLEGFSRNGIFADSTLIFIVSKKEKELVKIISTGKYNIHTIGGLFHDNNFLWGVDRNSRKIFRLKFDDNLDISEVALSDITAVIPKYNELQYTASFEAITMDDLGNLFLIDDPWKKFFIPSPEVFKELDNSTKDNFQNYIPILFKFKIQ